MFSTPQRGLRSDTGYGFISQFALVMSSAERLVLASLEDCRDVVVQLATKWSDVDPDARRNNIPDRTVELSILDLDVSFRGRLVEGDLVDIVEEMDPTKPDVRVVMTSDDLLAMNNGELKFAHAWATGRVRLDAGIRDLLRLRTLMNRSAKSN